MHSRDFNPDSFPILLRKLQGIFYFCIIVYRVCIFGGNVTTFKNDKNVKDIKWIRYNKD